MSAKYVVRKVLEPNDYFQVVAQISVDHQGGLTYTMVEPDASIEAVLQQAQREGGLYRPMPFSLGIEGGPSLTGRRQGFVPIEAAAEFADAIEYLLHNALVDREN